MPDAGVQQLPQQPKDETSYVGWAVGLGALAALGGVVYVGYKGASAMALPLLERHAPELVPHYKAMRRPGTLEERLRHVVRAAEEAGATARALPPRRAELQRIELWVREPDAMGDDSIRGFVYGRPGTKDGEHITIYPTRIEGDVAYTARSAYRLGKPLADAPTVRGPGREAPDTLPETRRRSPVAEEGVPETSRQSPRFAPEGLEVNVPRWRRTQSGYEVMSTESAWLQRELDEIQRESFKGEPGVVVLAREGLERLLQMAAQDLADRRAKGKTKRDLYRAQIVEHKPDPATGRLKPSGKRIEVYIRPEYAARTKWLGPEAAAALNAFGGDDGDTSENELPSDAEMYEAYVIQDGRGGKLELWHMRKRVELKWPLTSWRSAASAARDHMRKAGVYARIFYVNERGNVTELNGNGKEIRSWV